jgi:hypothetical protein
VGSWAVGSMIAEPQRQLQSLPAPHSVSDSLGFGVGHPGGGSLLEEDSHSRTEQAKMACQTLAWQACDQRPPARLGSQRHSTPPPAHTPPHWHMAFQSWMTPLDSEGDRGIARTSGLQGHGYTAGQQWSGTLKAMCLGVLCSPTAESLPRQSSRCQ